MGNYNSPVLGQANLIFFVLLWDVGNGKAASPLWWFLSQLKHFPLPPPSIPLAPQIFLFWCFALFQSHTNFVCVLLSKMQSSSLYTCTSQIPCVLNEIQVEKLMFLMLFPKGTFWFSQLKKRTTLDRFKGIWLCSWQIAKESPCC